MSIIKVWQMSVQLELIEFQILDKQLLIKDTEIFNLKEALEDVKRKTEFKSNLERSFESLQNQFQMKVDEIERLKKRLGIDEKNRRPSREKKIV